MEDMIRFENVSFEYSGNEKKALNNIDLTIKKGEFVAILGHNGSGKSTLAKHTNGILRPTSGKVYINNMDTSIEENIFKIRRICGMVFQNPDNQIVATMVEEDVAFAPENLGVPQEEIRKRVDSALKAVNMLEYKDRAPHTLSGGQKQRIAIAGIIAMLPECIVLDEPTAMLDPSGRREVMAAIATLNRHLGMTVVLITHYMNEAAQADRVIVMDEGRIILDDTPHEIFSNVSLLRSVGLDVPQTTELMYLLQKAGIKVPEGVLTVSECVDAVADILEGCR